MHGHNKKLLRPNKCAQTVCPGLQCLYAPCLWRHRVLPLEEGQLRRHPRVQRVLNNARMRQADHHKLPSLVQLRRTVREDTEPLGVVSSVAEDLSE